MVNRNDDKLVGVEFLLTSSLELDLEVVDVLGLFSGITSLFLVLGM
jgi:hypothetical protein